MKVTTPRGPSSLATHLCCMCTIPSLGHTTRFHCIHWSTAAQHRQVLKSQVCKCIRLKKRKKQMHALERHPKAMPGYLALCIEMFHNVSQCFTMLHNVSQCFTMFQKVVEEIVQVSAKKERTLNAHTTVGIRATAGAIALFAGGPHTISHFLATPHCCVGKRAQRTVKIVKTVKTAKVRG